MDLKSSFSWLDYSDYERRKMVEIIDAFAEDGTRDELGIGTIRDGIADLLFPGTGTVQTRARYFLFIAWIYQELEQKKITSREIQGVARKREIELIYALEKGGEQGTGVIGVDAREKLKRLPSNIYWQGLAAWGVRRFSGSQDQYHRWVDAWYEQKAEGPLADRDESSAGIGPKANWHPGLPRPEKGWRWNTTFTLTEAESSFLRDGIENFSAGSLLSHLVTLDKELAVSDFCWGNEYYHDFPKHNRHQVDHARAFSEVIHGAALLYNLLLAEKKGNSDLVTDYKDRMGSWNDMLEARTISIVDWDLASFWNMIEEQGIRIRKRTRAFVNEWVKFVQDSPRPKKLADNKSARLLIQERETELKKGLARLVNPRTLELWTSDAGTGRLNYRWGKAQQMVNDILKGLHHA